MYVFVHNKYIVSNDSFKFKYIVVKATLYKEGPWLNNERDIFVCKHI